MRPIDVALVWMRHKHPVEMAARSAALERRPRPKAKKLPHAALVARLRSQVEQHPELQRAPERRVRAAAAAARDFADFVRILTGPATPMPQGVMARSVRLTPAAVRLKARRAGSLPSLFDYCPHAIDRSRCVVCTPTIVGKVLYITGGGNHVHRRPDCTALAQGQLKVERRGGSPEPIEPVNQHDSRLKARDLCKVCIGR